MRNLPGEYRSTVVVRRKDRGGRRRQFSVRVPPWVAACPYDAQIAAHARELRGTFSSARPKACQCDAPDLKRKRHGSQSEQTARGVPSKLRPACAACRAAMEAVSARYVAVCSEPRFFFKDKEVTPPLRLQGVSRFRGTALPLCVVSPSLVRAHSSVRSALTGAEAFLVALRLEYEEYFEKSGVNKDMAAHLMSIVVTHTVYTSDRPCG